MTPEIWFDTDFGSDVDDALALSLLAALHHQQRLQLIGVSTSYGRTSDRAASAATLLNEFQLNGIPVLAGTELPLSNQHRMWATGLESDGANLELVIDTLTEHPASFDRPFQLLITGPCTNIEALLTCPGFTANCRNVVVMGGSLKAHPAAPILENNFEGDPKAVQLLLEQTNLPITLVPVDLTLKYPLSEAAQAALRDSSHSGVQLLQRWLTNWLEFTKVFPADSPFREKIYLHDPIAVAYLQWPELFTTTTKNITVLDNGEVIEDPEGREVTVCLDLDTALLQEIESRITEH